MVGSHGSAIDQKFLKGERKLGVHSRNKEYDIQRAGVWQNMIMENHFVDHNKGANPLAILST